MKVMSLLAVAMLVMAAGCSTEKASSKPVAWEYTPYSRAGLDMQGHDPNISRLGNEGWELVDVVYPSDNGQAYYMFKRAKK